MPSYYIYPVTDKQREMGESLRAWSAVHELSESFYGLIGAGTSMLFDAFPPVFDQICRIAGVDFDDVLPLYVSGRWFSGAEFDDEVRSTRKDFALVQRKFNQLYAGLVAQPGWEQRLVYPPDGYAPDPEYFADFPREQHYKAKEEFELWEEELFDEPDNIKVSFGLDLRAMLEFMEIAEAVGSRFLWLVGR